jgi:hypothetical protein
MVKKRRKVFRLLSGRKKKSFGPNLSHTPHAFRAPSPAPKMETPRVSKAQLLSSVFPDKESGSHTRGKKITICGGAGAVGLAAAYAILQQGIASHIAL